MESVRSAGKRKRPARYDCLFFFAPDKWLKGRRDFTEPIIERIKTELRQHPGMFSILRW